MERQDRVGPAGKGGAGTAWFADASGIVGRCFWGPVGGGEVPIRVCDWPGVVDVAGSMSYLAADITIRQEKVKEQAGWRSLRAQ